MEGVDSKCLNRGSSTVENTQLLVTRYASSTLFPLPFQGLLFKAGHSVKGYPHSKEIAGIYTL